MVERLTVPQITQQIVTTPVNLPGLRHSPILLSTASGGRVFPLRAEIALKAGLEFARKQVRQDPPTDIPDFFHGPLCPRES